MTAPGMPPRSFHMDWAGDWELYALDHGPPEAPLNLDRGQAVPVARWAGPRYGAVLMVFRAEPEDEATTSQRDLDVERLDTEVIPYRRRGEGWEEAPGSGGSWWHHPSLVVVPELDAREARLEFSGGMWSRDGAWRCRTLTGACGSDAATVEVEDIDGLALAPLESGLRVFVVAFDGEHDAILRVRDRDGVLLLEAVQHGYGPAGP